MTMECMGRQALACFVGTILARLSGEHKGHFYSTIYYLCGILDNASIQLKY